MAWESEKGFWKRVKVLTGTVGDAGVLDATEGRELKQLVLLNPHLFDLWTTLVDLLNDVAQTLWVALLYARGCVAAFLRRFRFLPRSETHTRNNILNHLPALGRHFIGAFHRTPCHRHHKHHRKHSALPLHGHENLCLRCCLCFLCLCCFSEVLWLVFSLFNVHRWGGGGVQLSLPSVTLNGSLTPLISFTRHNSTTIHYSNLTTNMVPAVFV